MEIHLVYGELAAKKFIFPIAKSIHKKFLVFYQWEGFGYALLEGALMGNALASFELIGPYSIIKNAWTTAKKYDRQLVLKSPRQHIN